MTRRILIVDDDAQMVQTLCDIVALQGWEARGVTDGMQAVEAVRQEPYTAVLMDVRMPGLNGVDTFRAMRALRPNVAVFLMTAFAASDLLAAAQHEGVARIFPKPVDLDEVLALVRGRPGRVLVVDDDPGYLQTLADVLEIRGFDVMQARGLAEALARLKDTSPGVVVLDLVMQGVEPAAAVTAIREASPGILFVLYSGHPAVLRNTASHVPSDWVRGCLQKPFPVEALLNALAHAGV